MTRSLLTWGLLTLAGCAVAQPDEFELADDLAEEEAFVEWTPPQEPELEPELEAAQAPLSPRAATSIPTCSQNTMDEVLAPATIERRTVGINCHLTLRPTDVVTKQLILQGAAASGVTLDCRGALLDGGLGTVNAGRDMIEVRSRKVTDAAGVVTWDRPEDVTIRNCRIYGSMRVYGMGKNGEGPDVRESSRRAGHVARVRNAAPRRITIDNMTLWAFSRTPLYIAPGVTYVTVTNSELTGTSVSVALYLDTESARNVIRNNYFHVTNRKDHAFRTQRREELAIDNSSENEIMNNRFSTLEGGGIYLYRNCGEGGTIRHGTPSHNKIINNVFYYNQYDGDNPAIYVGSRSNESRDYCDDEDGYPWGSSADNRSFARYNVVMQNQIYKRSVSDMIKQGDSTNRPNYIAHNQTVASEIYRQAGCYVPTGYKTFILHGQTLDVFRGAGGVPVCTGRGYTCDDGRLKPTSSTSCAVTRVVAECRVTDSNSGCQKTAACPAGKRLVGASAACNLEDGAVTDAQLASVPAGAISVVRASDNVSDGQCWLGDDRLSRGRKAVDGFEDRGSVTIGCREVDRNGGDCHIKAALYCR
jgi:hypothetical protein